MRKLLATVLLPLAIAASLGVYLQHNTQLQNELFEPEQFNVKADAIAGIRYIPEFNGEPVYENYLLSTGEGYENIFLFGSSELTSHSDAVSYRFISQRFTTQVIGIGEAGNQCFSIYSQLLAHADRLKNAPVVIILSPGWFAGNDAATGTPSEIWLKFNSPSMLQRINEDTSANEKTVFAERFSEMFFDINHPSPEHKYFFYEHQLQRNPLSAAVYAPMKYTMPLFSGSYSGSPKSMTGIFHRSPLHTDTVLINWDSLYNAAKNKARAASTNNSMGVNNEYYDAFIKGRHGRFWTVPRSQNVEMNDFHMLINFLKTRGANVAFVILPVNILYYDNAAELQPLVNELTDAISAANYPCYNMFTVKTDQFEKELFTDVMHPGDYGWLKISRFIIDNYHLNYERQ